MTELALVALASLFAGCVDAIVGGGGLILVPALFGMYPGAAPATLLGTNKGSGIWGTAWATWQFSRRVQLSWAALLPAALAAFAGSFAGAWALTLVKVETFKAPKSNNGHRQARRDRAVAEMEEYYQIFD